METGRGGPVGDIEDLGHVPHGQVEVVVQHDDGPFLDVDACQLGQDPLAVGDVSRGISGSGSSGVGLHVQLDLGPPSLLLRIAIADTDEESADPGVPGVGITQRAQILPGGHEGILHSILGAIDVAKDEVGDTLQQRESRPHQLREGFEVSAPGSFDERSLHGRHLTLREASLRAQTIGEGGSRFLSIRAVAASKRPVGPWRLDKSSSCG